MSLDALREALPAYAKDLSLNLSSLANETLLSDQQKWGTFLASAHAVGHPDVVKAIEAAAQLTPEARDAACSVSSRIRRAAQRVSQLVAGSRGFTGFDWRAGERTPRAHQSRMPVESRPAEASS